MSKSLSAGSVYDAYAAADAGESVCRESWSAINSLKPPPAATGETGTKMSKALETCASAYLFRQMSLGNMKTLLDGGMRPSAMQEYRESAQTAQSGVLACVAGFMSGGMEIGLKAEDFK